MPLALVSGPEHFSAPLSILQSGTIQNVVGNQHGSRLPPHGPGVLTADPLPGDGSRVRSILQGDQRERVGAFRSIAVQSAKGQRRTEGAAETLPLFGDVRDVDLAGGRGTPDPK